MNIITRNHSPSPPSNRPHKSLKNKIVGKQTFQGKRDVKENTVIVSISSEEFWFLLHTETWEGQRSVSGFYFFKWFGIPSHWNCFLGESRDSWTLKRVTYPVTVISLPSLDPSSSAKSGGRVEPATKFSIPLVKKKQTKPKHVKFSLLPFSSTSV